MVTFAAALRVVLDGVAPLGETTLDVRELYGRVLAEPVVADFDLPSFAVSSVDGYGVGVDALTSAVSPAQRLKVWREIAAGQDPTLLTLDEGEAVRLFTGSGIPAGVAAVVMQEDVERRDDEICLKQPVELRQGIRPQGAELRRGATVLEAGTRVSAPVLSLLATLGRTSASVFIAPKVAIVATGSELVPPGSARQPGQIYEAILPGIVSAVRSAGGEISCSSYVPDDRNLLRDTLSEAMEADIVLTCGGVSVGDHDLVRATCDELGVRERLWRVAMKPGKPFYHGIGLEGQRVFGLPGNPVAALVTFFLLVRPVLQRMVGREPERRVTFPLRDPWPMADDRDEFIRARVIDGLLERHSAQESHMLTGLADADVLAHVPAGSGPYEAGDRLETIRLEW